MALTEILHASDPPTPQRMIFDFSDEQQTALWRPVNDAVMGGASSGRMSQYTPRTAVFRGIVSPVKEKGFASIRTPSAEYNLAGCSGLTIVARGDGKKYKLNLADAESTRKGILFQAAFTTEPGKWVSVYLPFTDFTPTFRGRPMASHPDLDARTIRTFGLMISGNHEFEFSLEVATIVASLATNRTDTV